MSKAIIVFFIGWLSLTTAVAQVPAILYAVDGEFDDTQLDRTSRLFTLDVETGAVLRAIGDTEESIVALTVMPGTDELFGLTSVVSPNPNSIVSINKETAETTVIGVVGMLNGVSVNVEDIYSGPVRGLSSTATFDAIWLAGIRLSPGPPSFNTVVFFDVERGELRASDLFLGGTPTINQFGLAMDGLLVFAGCNVSTPAMPMLSLTVLSSVPLDPPPFPIDRPLESTGCIIAADNADGMIWGVEQLVPDGSARRLVRFDGEIVDPGQTVSVEILGDLPEFTAALAFGSLPAAAVPALGIRTVILLILLLAIAGVAAQLQRLRTGL